MSEQEKVYTEVKCHTPEQQKTPRNSKSKDSPAPSPPWKIIALILGVLCLMSLGAVVALVAKCKLVDLRSTGSTRVAPPGAFQDSHPSGNVVQQENIHQQQQTDQESHNKTRGSKGSGLEKWKQHGESCYHLTTDWKTWKGSKDYCSSLSSNLLKIETKDELDFVKSLTHTYHWIGLSRKTDKEPWLWEDGTALTGDLELKRLSRNQQIPGTDKKSTGLFVGKVENVNTETMD